jgi:hypothetical protein
MLRGIWAAGVLRHTHSRRPGRADCATTERVLATTFHLCHPSTSACVMAAYLYPGSVCGIKRRSNADV